MQTVYRQSFKKFYMQTGASESAFVWQLREERKEVSHWKAKNILLKTSRHYGNNDYTIIHARLDQLFFSPPPSSLIVEYIYIYISDTLVKRYLVARKKNIYIYIFVFYNIVFNNVRETSCFNVHSYSRESQDFHSLAFHEYITAELWRN